jgi:type III secretion protein Q
MSASVPLSRSAVAERLPRLAPAAAALLRRLFAAPLEWRAADLRLHLQAAPRQPQPETWVRIDSRHGSLQLAVSDSSGLDDIGDRRWWDYEPPSRTLAWGMAHETLLRQFGALLHDELRPIELRASAAGIAPSLQLCWTLASTDGAPSARGLLQADTQLWQRWQSLALPMPANDTGAWNALPLPACLTLRSRPFPLAELRATEPGDVLVLGTRQRLWSSLLLQAGGRAWLAARDGARLRVLGTFSAPLMEPIMPTAEAAATPETAEPASLLDAIPLSLSFQLGSLPLNLGELARLAPGYVFELPGRLDCAEVLLQANGRTIGRGELVAVGDTLGVQVLELKPDGLQ